MTSRLTEVAVDAADPETLAAFWAAALGYVVAERGRDSVELAHAEIPDAQALRTIRAGATVPALLFQRVPESKAGKNRLHFDLSPVDRSQPEEVERLLGLGARVVTPASAHQSWTVMQDPEGNEFCVQRSLAPGEFSL